jgi:hypothetical protein
VYHISFINEVRGEHKSACDAIDFFFGTINLAVIVVY